MKKIFLLFVLSLLSLTNSFAMEKLWYLTDTTRSVDSFLKNYKKIDILGPQTYFLKNDGIVEGKIPDKVQNILDKNQQIKVMPLLANISGNTFNRQVLENLLADTKNWQKVSKYLREEAANKNYYGWQLDLENLDSKYKVNLNEFVKYLKSEFAKDNLKLSIAIVGKVSDNEKDYQNLSIKNYFKYWAGAYDYKTLGENTDFVTVMAYDEPDSGGPIASIGWQKKVMSYALQNIAPEKISFGIPVYGGAYRSGEKKRFAMVDYGFVYKKITFFDKRDERNMTTGAGNSKLFGNIPWISYNQNGKNYTIWYENKDSFKIKYDFANSKNVLGVSMWVLGDEDPKIWEQF